MLCAKSHLIRILKSIKLETMTEDIILLCASQTGNAEDVSEDVISQLTEAGYPVRLVDLCCEDDLSPLKEASCILAVVSTWGEGEPPDDAVPFFENLKDASSLDLTDTPYAILGLGDTGYEQFCECAKILDRELARHGANELLARVDCDVWYDDELEQWISDLKNVFSQQPATSEL